jgi:uncharacterized membrane protein YeaQ/YmgE (transglycosylase-associated protein family)
VREILGSIGGAIAGATIAQLLGATEQIPVAAIAGAFCGPGILAVIVKTIEARRTPRP